MHHGDEEPSFDPIDEHNRLLNEESKSEVVPQWQDPNFIGN